MIFTVIFTAVVAWFLFGAIGALSCGRDFVRRFGPGREDLDLMVAVFALGPLGALVTLQMGAYKWQVRSKGQRSRLSRFLERTANR